MKAIIALIVIALFVACQTEVTTERSDQAKIPLQQIINDSYELDFPKVPIKGVLVLFGGFSEYAQDIRHQFNIAEIAVKNALAVVYLNYNQKLWLEENQKKDLASQLNEIFRTNKLPSENIYLGGYSSGGNIALLLGNYLVGQNSKIKPKGIFVVDSPIDLLALYESSEKNIARNFSTPSVQESTMLMHILGDKFGRLEEQNPSIERYAVYTNATQNIDQLRNLKQTKLRLYTEPDTLWWKENRMADPDQMNAFYLDRLVRVLKQSDFDQVEFITTKNKGYRANGMRHPHSWSIVDKEKLVHWILSKNT